MVTVAVWGSLRTATDGAAEVEVEAENFKQVLDALVRDYPGLAPQIERGVSMAIDGVIFKESWFAPVRPDSEVILMPLMAGG
ncbi:MAG: molybdopterin synthase sulfur carrier subunit [Paracoccaceae bacterium]|jgi:molybdopterin synthase sulfur carrier subunit